jgi:two-component system response regulator RpaA
MVRILSLSYESEMLELLSLILDLAGYELLRTTDAEKALSILRNQEIDLFTQDIMRPGIDGWELYRMMKDDKELCSIPVLFFSVARPSKLATDCYLPHGDEYLTLPFAPQELLRTVAEILRRHGKNVPTEEDRRARYEQVRGKLTRELKMSEEQLATIYEKTTGYLADL